MPTVSETEHRYVEQSHPGIRMGTDKLKTQLESNTQLLNHWVAPTDKPNILTKTLSFTYFQFLSTPGGATSHAPVSTVTVEIICENNWWRWQRRKDPMFRWAEGFCVFPRDESEMQSWVARGVKRADGLPSVQTACPTQQQDSHLSAGNGIIRGEGRRHSPDISESNGEHIWFYYTWGDNSSVFAFTDVGRGCQSAKTV